MDVKTMRPTALCMRVGVLLLCPDSIPPVIQSSSVEPIPEPELMAKFEGKNVMEQVTRFFHTNHVRRFMLKRPFHKGQKDKTNEYKTLHVERIVYTTSHKFPSILRWFEVKSTDVVSGVYLLQIQYTTWS